MKISLFKNDKSTAWDEFVLGIIVLICLIAGTLLIVFRPSFWIISANSLVMLGVFIDVLGVMYLFCLIYRLMTNDKKEK